MTRIAIDTATNTGKRFPPNWRRCVGSGYAALALRQEYQDALAIVQEEIGFSHIRGHGLLADQVGIYRGKFWEPPEDFTPSPSLNFTYVDLIYDSYLAHGIRPFVELSFMPQDLASGKKKVFWWQGNITPPRDYGEWKRLVTGLVSHLVSRYGHDEVANWPFEVWNEPDVEPFWSADQQEYFRLYRETARAIKEVDANLQVGGPATCPGGINWITPFLEMCDQDDVPADFVSTHSYSALPPEFTGDFKYQNLRAVTHSLDQFSEARTRVQDSPFPDLPLHITEYNTSYSSRCPIHDTALNAAFLGRLLSAGGDMADSFSYWTFSDVFEEEDVPRSIFHGGFGLLAYRGIRKPTFHLFSFFGKLGDQLLHRDEAMIVTRRDDGTVALVAWNPVVTREAAGTKTVCLDINLKLPEVVLKRQRVNEEYGNAWSSWRALGRPRYPSQEQIETLHHAAIPGLELERHTTKDGHLSLDLTLERNEISLVEIQPLHDDSDSYVGLDDAKIPGY